MEGRSLKGYFPIANLDLNSCSKIMKVSQYVSEVLDFSSHYGSDSSISYTAYNLSGKPSKFPDYGDFPQAFAMKTYGTWWKDVPSWTGEYMPQNDPSIVSDDYVDIQFERMVFITKVKIFETYNPGAVVRIWALNLTENKKKWALIWEGPPEKHGNQSRMFSPTLQCAKFPTNILRIEFNHAELDYHTGIDAVILEGTVRRPCITQQVMELNLHNIPCQSNDLKKVLSELKTCNVTKEDYQSAVNIESLPQETILKIFGYLDLHSLLQMAQVSRRLNELASDELLYTRLSLRPYWSTFCDSQLINLANRCVRLQYLDLSWCGSYGLITSDVFNTFVIKWCSGLTHIRLNGCKFVGNFTMKTLAETSQRLQELSLRNCSSISEAGFMHLTSFSHLTTLDLYRTQITGNSLIPILQENPNLQHLNIGSCIKIHNLDDVARQIGTSNKKLLSLDLWKTSPLSQVGVRALSFCSQLEELDLGWCLGLSVPVESLTSLARGCRKLKKLFLTALRGICDKDLEPFVTACPDLEQIDLLGVHGITPDGCLRLLMHLPKLRLLDLSFCYQISNADVARWRKCFPHVAIKRSTQEFDSQEDNLAFIP